MQEKSLKILVISSFNDDKNGGGEVYAKNLALSHNEMGHEICLVSSNCAPDKINFSTVRENYIGFPIYRIFVNRRNNRYSYLHEDIIFQWFQEVVDQEKPDVVHFHNIEGYCASIIDITYKRNIPTIFTNHDWWFLCDRTFLVDKAGNLCTGPFHGVNCLTCGLPEFPRQIKFFNKLIQIKNRLISRKFESLLTVKDELYCLHRACFMLEAMKKINLLHCPSNFLAGFFYATGVPLSQIKTLSLGIKTTSEFPKKKKSGKIRFGFMGRFHKTKGIDILLQAFSSLPYNSSSLELYGAPNPYIKDLLKKYPAQGVTLHGHVANNQIHTIFENIDILIVPSYYYENYPLVVQESFFFKTPVIVSDIGGLAEAVEDGTNGLHFQAGSAESLKEKLYEIIDKPEVIPELRRNIPPVKNIEKNAEEILSLYWSIIYDRRKINELWNV